jgi:hypothetical protein
VAQLLLTLAWKNSSAISLVGFRPRGTEVINSQPATRQEHFLRWTIESNYRYSSGRKQYRRRAESRAELK